MTLPKKASYVVQPKPSSNGMNEDTHNREQMEQMLSQLRSSPYMSTVMKLMKQLKERGLLGTIPPVSPECRVDYSLDSFLHTQGIIVKKIDECSNEKEKDFQAKLNELRIRYRNELVNLDKVCDGYCKRQIELLKSQSRTRLVTDEEIKAKLTAQRRQNEYVKMQLRQTVCNSVITLKKQQGVKTKRRAIAKEATEILNNWFFAHLENPYPTEEDKVVLATRTNLTLTQINNWFGNKRCRYHKSSNNNNSNSDNSDNTSVIGSTGSFEDVSRSSLEDRNRVYTFTSINNDSTTNKRVTRSTTTPESSISSSPLSSPPHILELKTELPVDHDVSSLLEDPFPFYSVIPSNEHIKEMDDEQIIRITNNTFMDPSLHIRSI